MKPPDVELVAMIRREPDRDATNTLGRRVRERTLLDALRWALTHGKPAWGCVGHHDTPHDCCVYCAWRALQRAVGVNDER